MSDTDRVAQEEAMRSWRRFFGGMLVLLLLVFGLILRSDNPAADNTATGANNPGGHTVPVAPQTTSPSTAPTTTPTPEPSVTGTPNPTVGPVAAKDLIAYTQDPVDYISKTLYANYQSQSPEATHAQIAATITPAGLKLMPDASTWTQTSNTLGSLQTTATWTAHTAAQKFLVEMSYEDGHWKLLALSPLS